MEFERAAPEHEPAIRAFNERIGNAGGFSLASNELHRSAEQPGAVTQDRWLVVDGTSVRGGVLLQRQPFAIGKEQAEVANIQSPLTEGIVSKQYAAVGMWMVRTIVRHYPATFAVGMGGTDRAFPRLLAAMGWDVRLVPFLFYAHRPGPVLRGLPSLRRNPGRRILAHAAAATGLGWLATRAAHAFRLIGGSITRLQELPAPSWGPWADQIWDDARSKISVGGIRTQETLPALYPAANERYRVFRFLESGRDVGWTCALVTPMRGNEHFGDLIVGTVLDTMAVPGYEVAVALATRRALTRLGVDVSVLNHQHQVWQQAFRRVGYLSAPSNYVLACSPSIRNAAAQTGDPNFEHVHVTRGDGDGRIHL